MVPMVGGTFNVNVGWMVTVLMPSNWWLNILVLTLPPTSCSLSGWLTVAILPRGWIFRLGGLESWAEDIS